MLSAARSHRIGEPVRRKEDMRLVTGRGRFSDDVNFPGQVYAVMLRSPHAHARIRGIDTARASAAPGVVAVLTGADWRADGLKPVPHVPQSNSPYEPTLESPPGFKAMEAPHFPLALDTTR